MIPRVGYHNKLLSMWTRRDGGATSRSGGRKRSGSDGGIQVRVQGGKPYFLDLPLPRSEPSVCPAIINLYNI